MWTWSLTSVETTAEPTGCDPAEVERMSCLSRRSVTSGYSLRPLWGPGRAPAASKGVKRGIAREPAGTGSGITFLWDDRSALAPGFRAGRNADYRVLGIKPPKVA